MLHSWSPEEASPDGVEMGMRLLSQGQFEEALTCFEQAYMERHFTRVAYLGARLWWPTSWGMTMLPRPQRSWAAATFPGIRRWSITEL